MSTLLANKNLCHVRTLHCFGGNIIFLPQLSRFEILRVLDFHGCRGLEQYLENIDKLFQLEYLSLCCSDISRIPTQIAKLQNLVTLDLRQTCVEEFPTEFCRLIKLQHLLRDRMLKLPDGIGNMRNLQVLSGINISSSSASAVAELGELTSLRDLKICLFDELSKCKTKEEMLLASLCKLSSYKLQSLHIIDDSDDDYLERWFPIPCFLRLFHMITNYYFPQLPKWVKPSLTKMAYLNVNLREIKEEDMKTLGDLPALLSLEIWLKPDPKAHDSCFLRSLSLFVVITMVEHTLRLRKGLCQSWRSLRFHFTY